MVLPEPSTEMVGSWRQQVQGDLLEHVVMPRSRLAGSGQADRRAGPPPASGTPRHGLHWREPPRIAPTAGSACSALRV